MRGAIALAGTALLIGATAGCGAMHAAMWGTDPRTAYGCYESRHAHLPDRAASTSQIEQLPEVLLGPDPDPQLFHIAREANVGGTVVVDALVCEHGRVLKTHVTKSIPMLDKAAVDAVQRMQFHPALSRGQPVSCWVPVDVTFGPY